jgi:hypothetical protein
MDTEWSGQRSVNTYVFYWYSLWSSMNHQTRRMKRRRSTDTITSFRSLVIGLKVRDIMVCLNISYSLIILQYANYYGLLRDSINVAKQQKLWRHHRYRSSSWCVNSLRNCHCDVSAIFLCRNRPSVAKGVHECVQYYCPHTNRKHLCCIRLSLWPLSERVFL